MSKLNYLHLNISQLSQISVLLLPCLAFNSFVFASNNIPAPKVAKPITISVGISKEVHDVYKKWSADKSCADITDYSTDYSPRGAVELVIFCKALTAADLNFQLKFIESGNYTRNLKLIKYNYFDTIAETIWYQDAIAMDVNISDAIFEKGSIEKGLYTRSNHPLLTLKPTEVREQIKNLVGVTIDLWQFDWQTIQALSPNSISAPSQNSIHRMINAKRADYCFGEFNARMSFELNGIKLVNIPKVKIKLNGSRHFILSKQSPNSEDILNALNKGIASLKDKGEIDRILTQAGLIKPEFKDWLLLN